MPTCDNNVKSSLRDACALKDNYRAHPHRRMRTGDEVLSSRVKGREGREGGRIGDGRMLFGDMANPAANTARLKESRTSRATACCG
mmetsp:Transcript_25668/g.65230  ORF Transcript_25668/g.65230 Transcript_25668/m.65230 type:complete len:86 (-) Transcript_25668:674-931(-)